MENLKIQSGRKESILTSDRSAHHPDSNGVNGTRIQVWMMELWKKEGCLVPLENEAFSPKNRLLAFEKEITLETVEKVDLATPNQ